MCRLAWAGQLWIVALLALSGCAENSLVLKGRVDKLQKEQQALANYKQQMEGRANDLAKTNEELERSVAQAKQENQLLSDQLKMVQGQLGGASTQLARVQEEKQATEQKAQALTASLQRRGGVSISPNNSFLQTLPAINIPGVMVRRDGDVIRIELPAQLLFDPGTLRVRPDAAGLVNTVMAEVLRSYPSQVIGVEGHTEADPALGMQAQATQQFAANEASAVYDILVKQVRVPPKQLVLVGHGANRPVVSNATLEGRQRNRRVELVIYPDRVDQQ